MATDRTYSVKHKKDEKNNVLIRTFRGEVDMNGVIASWEDDIKNNLVTKNLNAIITDFTDSENTVKMSDLGEITAFYNKNVSLFQHIKMGVVIDTPSVAILLMYEEQNKKFNHKAFATLEAALKWATV